MLPDIIAFFKKQQEYFPLANCYDVKGDNKRAQESNEAGIKQSVLTRDFRLLYYYCLQATYVFKYTQKTRAEIYRNINRDLQSVSLSPAEYYQFGHYFPMIKRLLFDNPAGSPTLSVSMRTNIESSDHEGLGSFLHLLETLQSNTGLHLDGQHIEVRRNSPAVIDWLTSGGAEMLFALLQKTYSTVQPILQDAANIVAIIGLSSILKKKKTLQTPKGKKQKTSSDSIGPNTVVSTDFTEVKTKNREEEELEGMYEITMLRDEIQCLFNDDKKSISTRSSEPNAVISPDTMKEKLTQWVDELQCRGIQILGFDIQILDGEKNILDHLYRQFFEQYYQGDA
jgi:hypothetical protein